MNYRSEAHLIPTAHEFLPNGTILELGRKEGNGEIGLLARDGNRYGVASRVECDGKTYVPVREHPTVLAALRLPTRVAAYGVYT
jgi:hypothetical protein